MSSSILNCEDKNNIIFSGLVKVSNDSYNSPCALDIATPVLYVS